MNRRTFMASVPALPLASSLLPPCVEREIRLFDPQKPYAEFMGMFVYVDPAMPNHLAVVRPPFSVDRAAGIVVIDLRG